MCVYLEMEGRRKREFEPRLCHRLFLSSRFKSFPPLLPLLLCSSGMGYTWDRVGEIAMMVQRHSEERSALI